MGIRLWKRRKQIATSPICEKKAPEASSQACVKGRRSLENSYYLLPKDMQEIHRLDFQHFILRRLLGGNYTVPLPPSTQRILDVGCGTGLWVREVAQQFPSAHIIGLDLELSELVQHHPANCQFLTGNILQGLPFPDKSFDFVHQRLLVAALPASAWPGVVRELVRVTNISGWIELLEIGQSVTNPGPATSQYLQWWMTLSEQMGFDTTIVEHLGDMLRDTGIQRVTQQQIKAPVGQWGGRAGILLATNILEVIQALQPRFCTALHISPDRFRATVNALSLEWEQYHTAFHFYLASGQK